MRLLLVFSLSLLAIGAAQAQMPSAIAPPPPPAFGGYALPAQVPYQPTMPGAAPAAPVVTYGWPQGQPAPVWQPYPTIDGDYPAGGVPYVPAGPPMQQSIYPSTPEPSLRESLTPPDARNGFFQKAKFTATWLPQLEEDSLGWTDLRAEVVTALPFFTRENPIIITPSYEVHFLDRPAGLDLPPRLHDLAIDFHVFRVYSNHWIADVALTPGLYADDYSFDSNDAQRLNGRAVGVYAPDLEWKWILGATYVHGGWAKVVPIFGFTYEPNDDVEYELVFPRPRVSWRLPSSPVPGRDEHWVYVALEFQNSIWAFQQTDGTPDVLASRDYRLLVGLERKIVGGLSSRVEVGYVFNRDIKVAGISGEDIGLDDTFLLRAGVTY